MAPLAGIWMPRAINAEATTLSTRENTLNIPGSPSLFVLSLTLLIQAISTESNMKVNRGPFDNILCIDLVLQMHGYTYSKLLSGVRQ